MVLACLCHRKQTMVACLHHIVNVVLDLLTILLAPVNLVAENVQQFKKMNETGTQKINELLILLD